MTLIKSLLLGTAAGIVAVASAQAADLPTKKAAPAAEYVKICTIGGTTGFVLPGSDTCLKISGYLTAQMEGGNLKNQYVLANGGRTEVINAFARSLPAIGYSTRGQVNFDAVSNTAYGPLEAYIEVQGNSGVGFDPLGNGFVLNNGWLSWAGITAGKHGSFYDFFAGGQAWKDFNSPDHSGGPINLLAYTASFGGGFSATVSLEQPEAVNQFANQTVGIRVPDIVGSLDVKQGWGKAHLAGVLHDNAIVSAINPVNGSITSKEGWGYGVNAGVLFNLPSIGAGDDIGIQAAYSHAAIGYSGVPSPAWGENDTGINTNGIGTLYTFGDGYWNGRGWSTPTAWTVAALADFHMGPNFTLSPEASYGSIKYSGSTPAISNNAKVWLVGAVFDYSPVHNLDFALDLIYESSTQAKPAAYLAASPAFVSKADGFNARLRITRSF